MYNTNTQYPLSKIDDDLFLSCLSSEERVAARPRLAPSDRWRSLSSPTGEMSTNQALVPDTEPLV